MADRSMTASCFAQQLTGLCRYPADLPPFSCTQELDSRDARGAGGVHGGAPHHAPAVQMIQTGAGESTEAERCFSFCVAAAILRKCVRYIMGNVCSCLVKAW